MIKFQEKLLGDKSMSTKVEDAAYLVLVERHISELEERLAALKNVITAMKGEGEDTSNQAELFANMSEAVRAMQRFREGVKSHGEAANVPGLD